MSDDLKKLVLDGRKEGKVVFFALEDTLCSADVKEFIKQPTNGILWDLNRLEEVALSRTHKPRWVNDFAVALTIRALKDRVAQLEKEITFQDLHIEQLESQIKTLLIAEESE